VLTWRKKILKNNKKTKKYIESLPKLYAIFLYAGYGLLEVPWSKKYDKHGWPLVYDYWDCNGCCDEYHLVPIYKISSGIFYDWYMSKHIAEEIRRLKNKEHYNE
jgi:hypothetical protein